MTVSDAELAASNPAIGIEITLAGGVDDFGGQGWRRGVAVPAAGAALRVEIVAQRLLVEARLRLAGLVDIHRPEPRAVRGHHLFDHDDPSVAIPAKFKFGVGNNDALVADDFFAERIDRAGHALQREHHLVPENFTHS